MVVERAASYESFIAPYDMDAPWGSRGVPGTYRFLNRAWNSGSGVRLIVESKRLS